MNFAYLITALGILLVAGAFLRELLQHLKFRAKDKQKARDLERVMAELRQEQKIPYTG